MNKKLLMSAVLAFGVGAMFTSCVDDTESATVTAIRQAKAEQLKAKAELDRANAEATLRLANAEAAAKEADAAYKQALANYEQALADYKKAETDAMKEKWALEVEQAKVALDEAKANLQNTLAKLDYEIAFYKYQTLNYQQLYNKLLAEADKTQASELQALLDAYQTASETLISAKRNLARETVALAKLEADLVSITESINDDITSKQEEIADKKIEIDGQKALIAAYEKYAGTEVTEEDIQAAHIKAIEAEEAAKEASVARQEAQEAKIVSDNNRWSYRNEVFNNWIYNNRYLSYQVWNETTNRTDYCSVKIQWVSLYDSYKPASARGKYCVVINEHNNGTDIYTYLPLFEGETSESNTIDYTLSYGNGSYSYDTYKTWYNLIDGGKAIETIIEHKEKELASQSNPEYLESLKKELPELEKAQADAQKAWDDAVKDYNEKKAAAEASYKTYQEAAQASQEAWDAYNNNTDADKASGLLAAAQEADTKTSEAWDKYVEDNNAMSDADNVKQNALNDLDAATMAVYNTNQNINNEEYYKEQLAEQIDDLKKEYAELVAAGEANDENLKAYNNDVKAEAEAQVAEWEANDAYNIAWSAYQGIQLGVDGGNAAANQVIAAAKQQIQDLEGDITDLENDIKDLNQDLADIEAGKYDPAELKKDLIADKKAEIEKLTIAVEVAQKKYDMAKDALDAALKSDTNTAK